MSWRIKKSVDGSDFDTNDCSRRSLSDHNETLGHHIRYKKEPEKCNIKLSNRLSAVTILISDLFMFCNCVNAVKMLL